MRLLTVLLALLLAAAAPAAAAGPRDAPPRAPSTPVVVAGTGEPGYDGDGGPATAARLSAAEDVAVDERGRVWIADTYNNAVRRVETDGTITTVVPPSAGLRLPFDLAVRGDDVVVADSYNHRVVRVLPDGSLAPVAGTGAPGSAGDGGPATAALLRFPFGVDLTPDGRVLVADTFNHRVREVSRDGVIRTVAGTGAAASAADGERAAAAPVRLPYDVAALTARAFAVTETGGHRVRLVGPDGLLRTALGTGTPGSVTTGEAATTQVWSPSGVAARPDGTLLVADFRNDRVLHVRQGRVTVVAEDVPLRGGVALSRDGRRALWAETRAFRVVEVVPRP